MKYNPKLKALVIKPDDLDRAYYLIMYSLKKMREGAGLPLSRYEKDGPLEAHDFAAIALMEAGECIGIDFEVTPHNHNKLDLTDI